MKLHLPSGLRKALVASLAAVASLLPTTLFSASALSGAALVSFSLSSRLQAADDDEEDDEFYGISPFAAEGWSEPVIDWGSSSDVAAGGTVTVGSEAGGYTLSGFAGYTYTFGGGRPAEAADGTWNLKLIKTLAGGATTLAGAINVDNLYLYGNTPANQTKNSFTIDSAGVLTAGIQNIYVKNVGLILVSVANTGLSANFIIGAASRVGVSNTVGNIVNNATIWTNYNLQTAGSLTVTEDAYIGINTNAYFEVSRLEGAGDLTVISGGANSIFRMIQGGDSFGGALRFVHNQSADNKIILEIGAGHTLSTAGLIGANNTGAVIRACNATSEDTLAKLKITGNSSDNVVNNATLSNIHLVMGANALQNFVSSRLTGALSVEGEVTLGLAGSTADFSAAGIGWGSGSKLNLQLDLSSASLLKISKNDILTNLNSEHVSLLFVNGVITNGWTYDLLDLAGLDLTDSELIDVQDSILGIIDSSHQTRGRTFDVRIENDKLQLSMEAQALTLTWNDSSTTWKCGTSDQDDSSWNDGSSDTYFARGDNAIFNLASGGTVSVSGEVAANDVTISGGGIWAFDGASLMITGALSIEENTSASFTTTGNLSLGVVTLGNNAKIVLKDLVSSQLVLGGYICGSGTVELSNMGTLNQGSDSIAFVFGTTEVANAATTTARHIRTVEISNGTTLEWSTENTGSGAWRPRLIDNYIVRDGSSLIFGARVVETTQSIYLEGSGRSGATDARYQSALYIYGGSNTQQYNRIFDFDITIGGTNGATIGIGTNNHNITFRGEWDGGGKVMTLTGAGHMILGGAFHSAEDSSGTFNLTSTSTLKLDYTAENTLATYSVSVAENAGLILGTGSYVISTLTGSGTVSATTTGTLKLGNATGEFSGTVASGVTVELAKGTWQLGEGGAINGAIKLTGGKLDITGATDGTDNLPFSNTSSLAVDVTAYGGSAYALKLTADQISNFATDISLLNYVPGDELIVNLLDVTGLTIADVEAYFSAIIEHIDKGWLSRSQRYQISAQGVLSIVGDPTDLVWGGGDGVWKEATGLTSDENSEKWFEDDEHPATYFGNGENVTFGKSGATNTGAITVSGSVTAGNMHVAMGEWTLSPEDEGSLAVNGTLTVDAGSKLVLSSTPFSVHSSSTINGTLEVGGSGALTMTGEVTVERDGKFVVNTSGTKRFAGGITVNGTGVLKIANRSGWTIPSLNGDGVLKLAYGEMSSSLANSVSFDAFDNVLWTKQGSGADTVYTMKGDLLARGSLKLTDNTLLTCGGSAQKGAFEAIKNFYVESGSAFIFRVANSPFGNETTTLYLEGDGGYKHVYTGSPEGGESIKGALAIGFAGTDGRGETNNLFTLAGNIELTNHASVYVQGGLGTARTSVLRGVFIGALKGNGYTFTKTGLGELQLNSTFSTTGAASKIAVESGTLVLGYTSGQALSGWSLDVAGTLNVSGTLQGGYEVSTLTGSGQVTGATNKLVIRNSDTAAGTSSFSGTVAAGATVEVAQGVWTLGAATINGIVKAAGGTLDVTNGVPTLGGSGSLQIDVASYGESATVAALRLTETQIANGDVAGLLSFAGFDFLSDDPADFSVKLLDLSGLSVSDFDNFIRVLNSSYLGRSQTFVLNGGVLTINGTLTELVWSGGDGVWMTEDGSGTPLTSWDWTLNGSTTSTHFERNENVTFGGGSSGTESGSISISGDVQTGNMTVVSGEWNFTDQAPADESSAAIAGNLTVAGTLSATGGSASFANASTTLSGDVTVSQGAKLTFSGSGSVEAHNSVTIESDGTLALLSTGAKKFDSGILVKQGGTLQVAAVAALATGSGAITGAGTLAFVAGNYGLDNSGVFAASNAGASGILTTGVVELQSGAYLSIGANGLNTTFNRVVTFKVSEGGSLTFGTSNSYLDLANLFGTTANELLLAGNGAWSIENSTATKGALIIANKPANGGGTYTRVGSAVKLTNDASIYVGTNGNAERIGRFEGTVNLNGHTLIKTGVGTMCLYNESSEMPSAGTGKVVLEGGKLQLDTVNGAAYAGWEVSLSADTALRLSGSNSVTTYTLSSLSGSAGDIVVASGVASAVLKLDNESTAVDELNGSNVYAGGVNSGITVELIGGYQKLSGTLTSGSNYAASGTGTLALAGSLGGTHHISADDTATVDMDGAELAATAKLVLSTAEDANINNLHLTSGATLGVAAADATEAAAESVVNLGGDLVLDGGSILQFDVAANTDASGEWHTTTQLAVKGDLTLNATDENTIKVKIDPYGRMSSGEISLLGVDTEHVLLSGANLNEGDLALFEGLLGDSVLSDVGTRFRGALQVNADGDLVLVVSSVAAELLWNKAEGGAWNTDTDANWVFAKASDEETAFMTGDVVKFTTLTGATNVTVQVSEVKVGGITVTGSTSYVLSGDIGGMDDGSGAGLVVGTTGELFSATLTLTGDNAWGGDNIINSGTVVAQHTGALSTGSTTLNGGELDLDIAAGGTLGSTLSLNGGLLLAKQSAAVNAGIADSTTLAAMQGATLTANLSAVAADAELTLNSTTHTGQVKLVLAGSTTAAALLLQGGSAELSEAQKLTTATTLSAGTTLTLGSGATLAGSISGESGSTLDMQSGSKLELTGTGDMSKVIARGSTLQSSDTSVAHVGTLTLSSSAELTGSAGWNVDLLESTSGSSSLTIATGSAATVTSGSTGTLTVSNGATLRANKLTLTYFVLGDAGVDGDVAQLLAGDITTRSLTMSNGVLTADTTLNIIGTNGSTVSGENSSVEGTVTIDVSGAQDSRADLAFSDGASFSGEVNISHGRMVVGADAGDMTGSVTLSSTSAWLDLGGVDAPDMAVALRSGGSLQNASSFAGSVLVTDAIASGSSAFELGGLSSAAGLTLNLTAGSVVKGLGDSVRLVGESTISLLAGMNLSAEEALLQSTASSVNYSLEGTLKLVIDDIYAEVDEQGEMTYYLFNTGVSGEQWAKAHTVFTASLLVYHLDAVFNADGSITFRRLEDAAGDVFVSSDQGDSNGDTLLSDYDELDSFMGVVIDRQTTVDLQDAVMTDEHPDGLVMRNITGTTNGQLDIEGAGSGQTLVTLQNTLTDDDLADYAELNGLEVENVFVIASPVNVNNADLQIKHVGDGDTYLLGSRTVMSGDLSLVGGKLLMTSGELEITGSADVEDVIFAENDAQLIISATTASVANLSVRDRDARTADDGTLHAEHVRLEKAGVLRFKDGASVGEGIIIGNTEAVAQAAGTVDIAAVTTASISASASLRHVVLHVNGELICLEPAEAEPAMARAAAPIAASPADAAWTLAGLTGTGALSGSKNIGFSVAEADRTFRGNLAGYSGVMSFGESSFVQTFSGVTGSKTWSVDNLSGGRVVFDLMGGKASNRLAMGDLMLEDGSFTTILMDLTAEGLKGLAVHELTIASGADVTIAQYQGLVTLEGADGEGVAIGAISADSTNVAAAGVHWHVRGVRNAGDVYVDPEDGVTLKVTIDNTNKFAAVADNANSMTGAHIMWSVTDSDRKGGDISKLDTMLLEMVAGEGATDATRAEANRVLAAVAGASVSVLGSAVSADVDRQLRAIRNRTTTMGFDTPDSNEAFYTNAWINAESNYHKQNADGMMPGFKTNGWGGTVGVSLDQSSGSTLGFALSAMYSDVESDGADRLKGDMDTMYLSAFTQFSSGAWRHTLVCSAGRSELDVNRTVNYGAGSYTTHGSTEGVSFGLLYEVGYSVPLNAEATLCLQPVLNVAWRYSQLNGYTETGSNAALSVDDMTYNAVTLGLGARVQGAVGANTWNRLSVIEGRALVKADLGDREGKAKVAFAEAELANGSVRSAERSVLGVELGVGITTPLSRQSAVFVDFSTDIRSAQVDFNATLGYKVSF